MSLWLYNFAATMPSGSRAAGVVVMPGTYVHYTGSYSVARVAPMSVLRRTVKGERDGRGIFPCRPLVPYVALGGTRKVGIHPG